jgi:phospholipid/cholesterol/gamma-HCH transport system permease protein
VASRSAATSVPVRLGPKGISELTVVLYQLYGNATLSSRLVYSKRMEIVEDNNAQPDQLNPQDRESSIESDYYYFAVGGQSARLELRGDWTILNVGELENIVDELSIDRLPVRAIDFQCGGLQAFDLSGAWLLYRTAQRLEALGFATSFSGFRAEHMKFIDDALDIDEPPSTEEPVLPLLVRLSLAYASKVEKLLQELRDRYLWFVSMSIGLLATLLNPRRFRWIATARHIGDAGINAIGIVALMAFMVAIVLGFQAQTQLAQFGAQIFTIDLVSISILREMGGLLTAILVAGRSGSAFAAEIGVMQLNEEVSAMETMGISPFETLIIPRLTALLICLPLLIFIADAAGLLGTLAMATLVLDIPLDLALERFLALNPSKHFMVGMIKAPFFAIVIGMIGTYRGFYVERSADAVGRNTTSAVVESIFMVIVVDALFSILFTEIGW